MVTHQYNVLGDIIVSPTRILILNMLFDTLKEKKQGLMYDELYSRIITLSPDYSGMSVGLNRHLDALVQAGMIESEMIGIYRKYTMTKQGLEGYRILRQAAIELKKEGLLDR